MKLVKRKCIVLNKDNAEYIQGLVNSKKVKNFSNAINEAIEDKILNEKFENSQNVHCLQDDKFSIKIVKKEN